MEITEIVTKNRITSGIAHTDDPRLMNFFRRSILTEIPTMAIDIVKFHKNTSVRHDEILALRLGQLPIYIPLLNQGGKLEFSISAVGPGIVTSHTLSPDLAALVLEETPICELQEGQEILADVIIREGSGRIHAKWSPISYFASVREGDVYRFSFGGVDIMDPETIISEGIKRMPDLLERPPSNLFMQVLPPAIYRD